MKYIRLTHMYLGVFLSPALLFFALTGALQTVRLHEPARAGAYKPPAWIAVLAQIHKTQTYHVPLKREGAAVAGLPPGESAPPSASRGEHAAGGRNGEEARAREPQRTSPGPEVAPNMEKAVAKVREAAAVEAGKVSPSPLPTKIFFLFVSLGLAVSTLLGLYMSFKFNRKKPIIVGLLLAGIAVPLIVLFL